MKELGLNAIRLRVWVNPKGGFSSKEDVLVMAKRAQALDMAIMIDFHYSDWWADPAKQNIPAAWANYSYKQMKRALAKHTTETLQLLKDNGIDVKWVQVDNETTNGFLWPMGRATDNMRQYAGLTDAGYAAVKKVYPEATVIVHLDCACDAKRYDFIFDGLRKYKARFDMIGVSVYPYWDIDTKLEPTGTAPLSLSLIHIYYELMNGLAAFHELNAPLLVGISRKSMIFRLLGTSPAESLEGTTVLNTIAMLAGSHILRVHDVRAAVEARTILEELDKTKA